MPQKTLWLITIACTISIGSLYYNQPTLALMSTDLKISVSFILFQFHATLWGLILGAILLDLGTQAGQISNKAKIYSLSIEFHNRLTTIYRVFFFVGGAIGSWGAAYGWQSVS